MARRRPEPEPGARWVEREIGWPECSHWWPGVDNHDRTRVYGYAGGRRPQKTDWCAACNRPRPRHGAFEWRGDFFCAECANRGVRPVTVHATWTELLDASEFAEEDVVEVEGHKLRVERVADEPAVADFEVWDEGGIGRALLLRGPSFDVWLTDRPEKAP